MLPATLRAPLVFAARLSSTLFISALPFACTGEAPLATSDDEANATADAAPGDEPQDASEPGQGLDAAPHREPDSGAPAEPDASAQVDAAVPHSRTPRRMLLVDEGNAAVHHVNFDAPTDNWSYAVPVGDPCCNLLRDIQLIGKGRLMLSRPRGFVELDLYQRGQQVREVDLTPVPGNIEAARRMPNGHTVVAGNGGGGVFVYEFDENDTVIEAHRELFAGLDNLRGLRLTEQGTFLFSSDTSAGKVLYEGTWEGQTTALFTIPGDVPAGHMTRAIRTGPNEVTMSTGYGASLIRIDTATKQITKRIGGAGQPKPEGAARELDAHFFAGFQLLENGDYVVANWINHGRDHNDEGYQVLQYDRDGALVWYFDQTAYPEISSLHNVIVLDGLDVERLYDDRAGVLAAQ